jgi:hypothetical protein
VPCAGTIEHDAKQQKTRTLIFWRWFELPFSPLDVLAKMAQRPKTYRVLWEPVRRFTRRTSSVICSHIATNTIAMPSHTVHSQPPNCGAISSVAPR